MYGVSVCVNVYVCLCLSPFPDDACLELGEEKLIVEAVDGGDVGEDASDHVLGNGRLGQLSAKYLLATQQHTHQHPAAAL